MEAVPPLNLTKPFLSGLTVPLGTSWLMASCMECKGKQDLWSRQTPETLVALRERAMVQSVESSNRIEGVTVDASRLQPLVAGRDRPRDRSEEELAGYRRALDWIFSRKRAVAISPEVILKLHEFAQRGSEFGGGQRSDAGQWKTRNNEIVEISPNGDRRVRFVAATAKQTPKLIATLCRNYQRELDEGLLPPLLLAATFIFDFLCIHPFRDGNGRVSRLITTLLLQGQGIEVGRYISLERLIEETKEEYYGTLERCSRGWHTGGNDILPWWNYFLTMIRAAYREFAEQVEKLSAGPVKTEMVRRIALEQVGEFTLAEVAAQVPTVSTQLVKKVLTDLKAEKALVLTGRGRGARWQRRGQRR